MCRKDEIKLEAFFFSWKRLKKRKEQQQQECCFVPEFCFAFLVMHSAAFGLLLLGDRRSDLPVETNAKSSFLKWIPFLYLH